MNGANDVIEVPLGFPDAEAGPRRTGVLERVHYWLTKNALLAAIWTLLVAFLIVFFWRSMIITIPAGHQGVIWRRLWGTDLNTVYPEGTQFILPWNKMTVYDIRVQRRDLTVKVLSTDGLEISIGASVRYHPERKTLPRLHQAVGPEYPDRIVVPEVTAAVRSVMSQYRPQQLYTIRTTEMEARIVEAAAKEARDRYVTIDDVLIVQIVLPEIVQLAIQQKLRQEQEAEEYRYRLQKEVQEAERKAIEAGGIARFQQTVAQGISPNLLRWRGIEATLELAKSPNSKVIVVGGEGLPLILDTASQVLPVAPGNPTAAAPTAAPAPGPPGQ